MVSIDKIERGAAAFLDRELIPHMPLDSGKRVLVGVGASLLLKGYIQKLHTAKDNEIVAGAGLFDEFGNVDVDKIRAALMERMPDEGMQFDLQIPLLGPVSLKFGRADVDTLYRYITG